MVGHFDAAHQDKHMKHQFPDIAPHHRSRRRVRVNGGRGTGKHGEDDAGQHDDGPLQTDGGVAFQKALAHILAGFPGKAGQGDGGQRSVHKHLKKAPVDAQDHHEGQHPNEQPADQRHRPKGYALKKAAVLNGRHDLGGQDGGLRRSEARRVHNGRHDTLDDTQQGQHQLHTIGDKGLCQRKADKQL